VKTGLAATTDYWLRCYEAAATSMAFNGYHPSLSELGGNAWTGFWVSSTSQGEIVVTKPASAVPNAAPVCDVHAERTQISGQRITGSAAGVVDRPIYKIMIEPDTRVFEGGMPAQYRVPPYTIEGYDEAAGGWHELGIALPVPSASIDGERSSYGGATIYFQNKPGQNVTAIRARGGFTTTSVPVELGGLPAPTLTATQIPTVRTHVRSVGLETGPFALEANATATETIDFSIFDRQNTRITDTHPLAQAYDYVYFTDINGRLITGLYDPAGSTAITTGPEGTNPATPNTARSIITNDTDAGTDYHLNPRISLDQTISPPALKGVAVRGRYLLGGTATTGITLSKLQNDLQIPAEIARISDTNAAVYRIDAVGVDAAKQPWTIVVTQYRALVGSANLPLATIQNQLPNFRQELQGGNLRIAGDQLAGAAPRAVVQVITASGTRVGPMYAPIR
jgi:hypothetical protein